MLDICKKCGRTTSLKLVTRSREGWEETMYEQVCDLTPNKGMNGPDPKCLKETKNG